MIGAIAENDSREATDYQQLAELTLQLGQAAMQQGQRIPDESIWDGIHSVDAGQSIDTFRADWVTLRSELVKLLDKPPEDEQQQQQDEQDSEDPNQEDSENQENSEGQGDSNSEQSEDSDSQEQNGENSKTEPDSSGDQENRDSSEEGNDSQNQKPQTNQTLGDMENAEQAPELDQQPSPPKEEQNQVGGTQKEQPIRSAKQAMILQQLEQIKQQDKPGALHMLLQQAERDENAPAPQKLQKDW